MNKNSVCLDLSTRRPPCGEVVEYPSNIVDQTFLTVAQQVERFGIGCGNLPSSDLYDSDETCLSDDTVVSPYGLSDPVDVKIRQNVVDAVVDDYKAKAIKDENKIVQTKGVTESNTAVEGSGEIPQDKQS